MCAPLLAERSRATGGGRPQHLLAPYKQEVARSSRAPPILTQLALHPESLPLLLVAHSGSAATASRARQADRVATGVLHARREAG